MRWRGFSVSVTVPERLARAGRRPPPAQPGRLVFRDPPPVPEVKVRDPKRSLDFRTVAHEQGAQRMQLMGPTGEEGLSGRIRSQSWYHTIELPGGIVTPGQFDHRTLLARYGFPKDMRGLRALDAATFNGFWAFHMEALGAEVTAIDLDDPADWDFPEPVRRELLKGGEREPIATGFEIAREALDSRVHRVSRSLYDLDPEVDGVFDLVHCGDVLLHLREPLRALE